MIIPTFICFIKAQKRKAIHKVMPFFFSCVCISSCQTYTSGNKGMREALYAGDISKATKIIDASSLKTEDRNYALFRMEKGMLLYLNKEYDSAISLWRQADSRLDALYTTSISRSASSFAINDSMNDYEGEAHERVLLPIFSSIAFFANNNLDNASVMIRRTYDITNRLQSEHAGKNNFKFDSFSHYFSGMVYEAKKDWDSAIIEYRFALENLTQAALNSATANISAQNEALKALGRLAEYRHRNDIVNEIKKTNPHLKWTAQNKLLGHGEVYVIYECGESPIKVVEDIVIPAGNTVARISFPKYEILPYRSHSAEVSISGGTEEKTVIMENIGQMAQQALLDRRVRDLAKMSARVIAKDVAARALGQQNAYAGLAAQVFNLATEVADTRSWTTLPDTIQIARLEVPAGKDTRIEIKPQAGTPLQVNVKLNAGEKKLLRLRTFN